MSRPIAALRPGALTILTIIILAGRDETRHEPKQEISLLLLTAACAATPG